MQAIHDARVDAPGSALKVPAGHEATATKIQETDLSITFELSTQVLLLLTTKSGYRAIRSRWASNSRDGHTRGGAVAPDWAKCACINLALTC